MKKFLAILLALLFVVALFGCGSKGTQGGDNKGTTTPPPTSQPTGKGGQQGGGDEGPAFPKVAGYYDPDFDYTNSLDTKSLS